MLNRIVGWSLENRLIVVVLAGFLIYFGIRAASESPLDVFPDFAPPQVVMQTEAQGLSPDEVEQLVSLPLENALNGTPDLETIRSSSAAGLSVVTCIFTTGTDIFRARQLVAEKLQLVQSRLPDGIAPEMMPISAPVGILMKVSLTSHKISPMDLRTLADWTIRPRLLAVPGVSQVTIFGGEVKQYQVIVDPAELQNHNVSLAEVMTAAARSNQNAGAGFMDSPGQSLVIRGLGRVHSVEDLQNTVIALKNGLPVLIRQVASVRLGPEYKIGDASTFGKPSVILIVNKQPWANTLTTTRAVDAAFSDMRNALPQDVVMDTDLFRQSDFIETAISNINSAMVEGGLLVVIVLLLFLTTWRAVVISLMAIPLSLLVAIVVIRWVGGTINSMTLGGLAIAIGAVVDDAIIDVENVFRRLRENRLKATPDPVLTVILHASLEVRTSIFYASVIIVLVFMPIFSLSGLAGSIFAPLGYAYIIAILASLVVALTLTPALCSYFLPQAADQPEDSFLVRHLKRLFKRTGLDPALNHPKIVIAVSAVLLAGAVATVPFLGGEFLPDFNEGNLILHMTGLPGTSLQESMRVGKIVQARLAEIPETVEVAQQAGRAELGEDTNGPYFSEFVVKLKQSNRPRDVVMADVREKLQGIQGFTFGIKQFIAERIEEVLSGTTATVGVKVFGPDLDVLQHTAEQVQSVMASVPGVADLALEQQTGVPQVAIQFDREALALHGLTSTDLADTLQAAFYGTTVSNVVEQQKAFAILVRYDPKFATDVETMRRTLIDTPGGGKIPLGSLADIRIVNGPNVINRENAQRRAVVSCNISSGSLTGVVEEIKQRVNQSVKVPTGYYIVYGGQYEAQIRAVNQITVLGIAAVIGIFMLLFLAFRSMRQALLVMANLPLALIGGVTATLLFNEGELSIASLVGFVTLFGIATRNGIMLVTHYNHLMDEEGMTFGRDLVVRGAMERLSPILMTALVAGLALLPLAVSAGKPGRELEQPMAVVILGGLFSSMLLNMVVLPALYLKFGKPTPKQPMNATVQGIIHE